MNFRLVIALLFLALLAACVEQGVEEPQAPTEPPNIIVIFTDDHGYGDMGYLGIHDDLKTPHIDALARRGVTMTDGYVTAPTCTPSRAGLMTGRYQQSFGVDIQIDLTVEEGWQNLDALETIAERLQDKGYATGMAGKWHLGKPRSINDHGFDMSFEAIGGKKNSVNFMPEDYGLTSPQLALDGYHIDQGALVAKAFIEKHKEKPFFFYWAPRAPHVPLDAAQKYLDRFPLATGRRQQALAMLSALDDGVGGMIESLEQAGVLDNTLIFFIGDNGAPLRVTKREDGPNYSGWDGSLNDPLIGEKSLLLEGGIRVPFIVSWPARIPSGVRYDQPVTTLDVAATAAVAAKLETDSDADGKNLLPYLEGDIKSPPHADLYWRFRSQSAIRSGDWKLIQYNKKSYLYNLREDLSEQTNLIDEEPTRREAMETELEQWLAQLPNPALSRPKPAARTDIFYQHYLEKRTDINLNRLYPDWTYGITPEAIVQAVRKQRLKEKAEAEEKK